MAFTAQKKFYDPLSWSAGGFVFAYFNNTRKSSEDKIFDVAFPRRDAWCCPPWCCIFSVIFYGSYRISFQMIDQAITVAKQVLPLKLFQKKSQHFTSIMFDQGHFVELIVNHRCQFLELKFQILQVFCFWKVLQRELGGCGRRSHFCSFPSGGSYWKSIRFDTFSRCWACKEFSCCDSIVRGLIHLLK